MDIAAEAVADMIAPLPRPTSAANARDSDEQPSFGDLVQAATDSGDTKKEPKTQNAKAQKPADASEASAELAAALAPTAPTQAAAPALLEAIAQLETTTPAPTPQGEQPQGKPTEDLASSAKSDALAATPLPDAAAPQLELPQAAPALDATPSAVSTAPPPAPMAPTNIVADEPPAAVAVQGAALAAAIQAPAPNMKSTPLSTKATNVDASEPKASSSAKPALPIDQNAPPVEPARDRADEFKQALEALSIDDTNQPATAMKAEKSVNAPTKPEAAPPALPPLGAAAPAQDLSPVNAAAHARLALPAMQVAQEIIRRFDGDTTTFQLRLDPPELGRVDIRLDVARDHRVTATVAADNPQALADLVRHARDLEQTLQSAGLTLSENGLSFDLRQGGERNGDAGDGGANAGAANGEAEQAPAETQFAAARPMGFEIWRGVRLDITV